MEDSRVETILKTGINGESTDDLIPQSRNEALLIELINKIGAGGSDGASNSLDADKMNQFCALGRIDSQLSFTDGDAQKCQQIVDAIGVENILMVLATDFTQLWQAVYGSEDM